MNRNLLRIGLAVATALAAATTTVVAAQGSGRGDREDRVHSRLSGYNETPSTLSSPGRGSFRATIDRDEQEIRYVLRYSDLTATFMAHIHFGARATSGGISAWLCGAQSAENPTCPAEGGTVTGTITPAEVVGPASQGIAPQEFNELVKAILAGATYVNVHTEAFPSGEIRGQLR